MIGMKKYVRISRFAHFKRLRDRPTNRPTNRQTDMTSYRSARTHLIEGKERKVLLMKRRIPRVIDRAPKMKLTGSLSSLAFPHRLEGVLIIESHSFCHINANLLLTRIISISQQQFLRQFRIGPVEVKNRMFRMGRLRAKKKYIYKYF